MRSLLTVGAFVLMALSLGWLIWTSPHEITSPAERVAPAPSSLPPASAPSEANRAAPATAERRPKHTPFPSDISSSRQSLPTHWLQGKIKRTDPRLAEFLGLTADEVTRLGQALDATEEAVLLAQASGATLRLSADGDKYLIDVPAIDPGRSRIFFDELERTFRTTLGDERLRQFFQNTDRSFESLFDQFGLFHVRYEVSAQPLRVDSDPSLLLQFSRNIRGPDPQSQATGWSDISLVSLQRHDRLLLRLLPSALKDALARPP